MVFIETSRQREQYDIVKNKFLYREKIKDLLRIAAEIELQIVGEIKDIAQMKILFLRILTVR